MKAVFAGILIASATMIHAGYAADAWAYGIGVASCREWVPARDGEVTAFVFGYWTATNSARAQIGKNGDVGYLTESEAAVAEVKSLCRQFPGMPLVQAIATTYVKIQDREAKLGVTR